MKGPGSFSFAFLQYAGSEIDMKNSANPGLADSGFGQPGPERQ